MPNKDYVPEKEIEFKNWSDNLMNGMDETGVTALIPQEEHQKLSMLWTEYSNKYNATDNPETRTKITVHARQKARNMFETDLRRIVKSFITYNITVNDDQRLTMGLPIHKTSRTRSKVASTMPSVKVVTKLIRHLIFKYVDANGYRAKPEDQRGMELAYVIGKEKPVSISQLVNSVSSTHSPLYVEFSESERGKIVWFAVRWENTRGEKGPWSEIFFAIIP